MPCARLNISPSIVKFYKKCDDSYVNYSGKTLIIPIITIGGGVPFRPKGQEIGQIIIHSKYFRKISKQKFNKIIQKFNRIFSDDYICENNKITIEENLIDDSELFIRTIILDMGWNEEEFNRDVKILLNKNVRGNTSEIISVID